MKLIYVGWRDEIVLKEQGVVKKGVPFDCAPEQAAYLMKRFNLPGADVMFEEKVFMTPKPEELKPKFVDQKTGKKIII
jgi:hypothetical protein